MIHVQNRETEKAKSETRTQREPGAETEFIAISRLPQPIQSNGSHFKKLVKVSYGCTVIMADINLSRRDFHVLQKIKDPESDPTSGILLDVNLPKDPHLQDQDTYDQVSRRERDIISQIQNLKAGLRSDTGADVIAQYRECVSSLDSLISEYPMYASAKNNRAQALRRLYGDAILSSGGPRTEQALIQDVDQAERLAAGKKMLDDLDQAIFLLTPSTPYAALSPQAAKTLAMAHTQRAACYRATSKLLPVAQLSVDPDRQESGWTEMIFEERASHDFALGGRYGSDIAKALAVGTNPTAKLCGQMVREAMRKEYGENPNA